MKTARPILWRTLPIPLALFALLFTTTGYVVDIEEKRLRDLQRGQVLMHASATRARLESELNATLYITTGLTGYITINPKLTDQRDVQKVLQTLFLSGHHLRNIGLAPNNILTHVFPLEGNKSAIGLNYRQHAEQWPAVERAINSRNTVLAGPVQLVQGGIGLISRTPVFMDNDRYWGILSLVIDIDSLFSAAGVHADDGQISLALRGEDGLGVAGATFFGKDELFGYNPVLLSLTIPGGKWQMAAVPTDGWDSHQQHLAYFRIFAALISLLLATMLWVILVDRRAIKHIALHDPLTGLANRRLFDERLNYTLLQRQRQQHPFALLSLDLNGFKPINDQFGHKAGDIVLREVGRRINSVIRQEDTLARVGGDEFMIILPSTTDSLGALKVAEKIRQAFNAPFTYIGNELTLSTSIGASLYPLDGENTDELLRAADQAMYAEKKRHKTEESPSHD